MRLVIQKGETAQRVEKMRACTPGGQRDKQALRTRGEGLGGSRQATEEDSELVGSPKEWMLTAEKPGRSLGTRVCSSRNFCRQDGLRRTEEN